MITENEVSKLFLVAILLDKARVGLDNGYLCKLTVKKIKIIVLNIWENGKQAGDELCQAHFKIGLAK